MTLEATLAERITAGQIVTLEQVDAFRFRRSVAMPNMANVTFGGQLLALAVRAAQLTGIAMPMHTCTGYFLAKTLTDAPLDFIVDPVKDGARFAMRRVLGMQNEKQVFDLLCSFNTPCAGLVHQAEAMGSPQPPEMLATLAEVVRSGIVSTHPVSNAGALERHPIETRPVHPATALMAPSDQDTLEVWLRVPSASDIEDQDVHSCLLAMISDWWLGITACLPHRGKPNSVRTIATVNHSMWFHAPARVDEWLFYRTKSPWAGDGRALVSGTLFNRDGKQVATVAQELAATI
jgi:acyl-CoA thioesterase-2